MLLFPETNTMQQHKPAGFFSEDNGNKSMARLMSFLCLLAAIGFGVRSSMKPVDQSGSDTQLVVVFLTASVGTKVGQKFAEKPREEVP